MLTVYSICVIYCISQRISICWQLQGGIFQEIRNQGYNIFFYYYLINFRSISPSKTRELLIEIKDPMLDGKSKDVGPSHFFCIISIRDLLTTSNQKHIIPLLSFRRSSAVTAEAEAIRTVKNQQVSATHKLPDASDAENTSYQYHYLCDLCNRNSTSVDGKNNPNMIEASITLQVRK